MTDILVAIGLSTLLAALAVYKKALTRGGLVLAWVSSVIITYCGGLGSFIILAATFVLTVPVSGLKKAARRDAGENVQVKTGRRDTRQVFCNVGTGAIMLLIGLFTDRDVYKVAYAAAMAASLSDSMASGIGMLSKEKPVDICTLRKTERGMSGGVTVPGLFAALFGASVIGAIFALFEGGFRWFLLITACGFAGSLFDSVLGSAVQAKYRCKVCGTFTEKRIHCGEATKLCKGSPLVDNDLVNFLNNVFAALLALLFA